MPDNRSPVDGARVLSDLNALRAIGAYKTGVHKPTFSEPHLRSLEWLAQRLAEAGLSAEIDGIGNVLGTSAKPGAKLLAGSHLESQNYAGWLDGPLGVVYALEAARVLNPDPAVNGAVEVASWCDEEGHFGHFLGSRSYVGTVTEADIDAAHDRSSGKSMREALRDSGLAGRVRATCERGRHIGYLEAHIEQGETLESSRLAIGIVTSIGSHSPASKTTPAPRGWRSARMPASRSPGSASTSMTASRRYQGRARSGPPAASPSIPARRASSPAPRRCCFRFAMTTLP